MRARSCAQPSRHSNGSARPPGAVQRAHRPLQPHQMIQPAVRHAKSDAEQPRGLGDSSGQWSRPDASGRRRARVANSRSAIQPARPTQRHLASGAGGRVASSLYRRTADRRGHQRRSATMVARRSTPAAAGSPLSRSLPPERSRGERPFRSSRSRKGGVRNREAPSGGGLACTTLASAQTRAPEPESAACAVRTSHERRADRDSGGRPRPPGEASATSVLKFAR